MAVDVTVQKVGGKQLDAVPLVFSLSGKGKRGRVNKIDLSLILSIKKKDKIKECSSGCTVWLLMYRIQDVISQGLATLKCWTHHLCIIWWGRLIISVIWLFKLSY